MIHFEESMPETQNMDTDLLEGLRKKLRSERISACVILRRDRVVFSYYKNKKAETNLHPIHSCTKSFTSALVGICLRQGLISSVHVPIVEYFGDMIRKQPDERKQNITLYHLLTMSEGFDWPEFGDWQFFSPMEYSKDMIRFILERELEADPGTKMNYNSGCSHLLSAIVQKVSGIRTSDFARKYLFTPLGIEDFHWHEKQNVNLGANGLKMRPQDMLMFGYLYLREGIVRGKEILPGEWVRESATPRFLTYQDIGQYGYHWWVSSIRTEEGGEVPFYFAMGLFGQYIIVVPQYDMVVVFVSENYSDSLKPLGYFREYIAKAVCE